MIRVIGDRVAASLRWLAVLSFVGAAPVALASVDYGVDPGDLVLNGSARADDGQVIGVTRTIRNLEGASPPCPYSYFLNPPSVFVQGNGIPVAILGPTGPTYLGSTPAFAAYGVAGAIDTGSDQIVLPQGVSPGSYNLVLVLDPGDQVEDADSSNNAVAVSLTLGPNPLQITSPSSLVLASLGIPYLYQLEEAGAGPELSWTLQAGSLPPGVTLDSSGELSGTPTEAGAFTFVVELASQGGTQVAVLQLPVAAGAGPSIEQSGALPTAIVTVPYLQQLDAEGGVPPYTWVGTIPQVLGMQLSAEGVLSGTPEQASNGPVQLKVVVVDSIGNQASATLSLEVIAPGSLLITTPTLAPAVVGVQYDQPIAASDGTLTGAVFNWTLGSEGPLPTGITFAQSGDPGMAEIGGAPTQAGTFPLVVNVSDNLGHTASRLYILIVTGSAPPVPSQTLAAAVIGERYAAQLQGPSVSSASWSLFSGQLPPGLSLSATGAITGTVPAGTVTGFYPFAVTVMDPLGGEAVASLEIEVVASVALPHGCATGAGTGAGWLLLVLLAVLHVHRDLPRIRDREQ